MADIAYEPEMAGWNCTTCGEWVPAFHAHLCKSGMAVRKDDAPGLIDSEEPKKEMTLSEAIDVAIASILWREIGVEESKRDSDLETARNILKDFQRVLMVPVAELNGGRWRERAP